MDPRREERIFAEKFVKIICIGAGPSGLLLAYKLRKHFQNFSLTVYEKNDEISGTWHENTYPGCACDVPAHNYTYSFEPKHDWSSIYASSTEIKSYFQAFSRKHELGNFIKTSHVVTNAQWQTASGEWTISIHDTRNERHFTDQCHILINAGGYLNKWAWPKIPGRSTFRGTLLHTAAWDHSVQLEGKRVALLGSGSSAVQVLPKIQPLASQITTFVRSPLWILPTIASGPSDYSQEEIDNLRKDPKELMRIRKYNESVMNSIFSLYLADSPLQKISKTQLENSMRSILGDAELEDALVPSWGVGCRRLNPDIGYLQSIKEPNVRLIKTGVAAFTPNGCVDDNGEEHEFDIGICATGFDTSFIPRFPIIGMHGKNLQDMWADAPSSYMGIGVAHFPNYLTILGPYSPVANGPTLASIEAQTDHILKLVDRYQTEPIQCFCPSPSAQADFVAYVGSFMQNTVYNDSCRSGHKNHTVDGRVPTLWPGSTLHHVQALQDLRAEDWIFEHTSNRFAFLGNGISHAEFDPTSDLAYYIRESDDGSPLTRRGRMELMMRSGSQPARELHRTHRPSVINLHGTEEKSVSKVQQDFEVPSRPSWWAWGVDYVSSCGQRWAISKWIF